MLILIIDCKHIERFLNFCIVVRERFNRDLILLFIEQRFEHILLFILIFPFYDLLDSLSGVFLSEFDDSFEQIDQRDSLDFLRSRFVI